MRFLALAFVFLALAPAPPQSRYLVAWAMESNVYPADGTGHDFLAVFDIGDPARSGRLVAMLPVPTSSQIKQMLAASASTIATPSPSLMPS